MYNHSIFQNYTDFTAYDSIFFFHAWLEINLLIERGNTAVDWLRLPYFTFMMSEYCRKIPH